MKLPSWPVCLMGIFVVNGIGVAIVLFFALQDPAMAVEPGYYEQALAWDEHREQEQRNEALSWGKVLSHEVAGNDPTRRVVSLEMSDREGAALEGASIEFVAFNAARAKERLSGSFTAVGGGRYDTVLTIQYPGLWVFRLRCERGGDVFTHQGELRIVPSAGGR